MNKICYGCGAKLQSDDKNKLGYVPNNKINDASYCMRCFRMTHYGETPVAETPKDVHEIVNKINKDIRFVIFLVDYLNINEEVMKIFKSIKREKMLIINKCELLPRDINQDRFVEYIQEYYGINDVIKLKGGKNGHGAKGVLNYLTRENIKEAYILGLSNSGKSTLINDLLEITGSKMNKITVNAKANTTLDFIRVKIGENLTLIDSPGFIIDSALEHNVTGKDIIVYNMQMKECETLSLLDNKYFMKFDSDTSIVFYTNAVAKKVVKKYFKAAPGLTNKLEIKEPNTDIILKGIGFITVKKPCVITMNIELSHIEVRKSMFGDING